LTSSCGDRSMRFDPEGNTAAAAAAAQHGAVAGPTGNPYMQNGAAAYGGAPGANGYGAPYGAQPGAYAAAASNVTGSGARPAGPIKLKDCSTPELLQHLPTIQKLLARLMQCVPEGASAVNPVILVRLRVGWSKGVAASSCLLGAQDGGVACSIAPMLAGRCESAACLVLLRPTTTSSLPYYVITATTPFQHTLPTHPCRPRAHGC
jgi:hypothetical protein